MKTNILIAAIVLVMSITGTAMADKGSHHATDSDHKTMSGMANMGDMEKHMSEMQGIMEKIKNTKNAKERQKLMSQHMEEMHEGIDMMQNMMTGKMNDMNMDHESKEKMMGTKDMKMQQSMMTQRMDMMQSMMGQMMNHMDNMMEMQVMGTK